MLVAPKTIEHEILNEIVSKLPSAGRYLTSDSLWLRQMQVKISRLMRADAIAAYRASALVALLKGDRSELEEHLNRAERLSPDISTNQLIRMQHYTNFCLATESQALFKQCVGVKFLNLQTFLLQSGLTIAAFQEFATKFAEAQNAGVEVHQDIIFKTMKTAAELLRENQVSDEDCARVIDCAGEVLRRRGMHWVDESPKLEVYEKHANVALRYRVDATYTEAADMTAELVMDLIDKDLDDLPFYVTFEGSYR
ncbi:MAG: hypothetical protein FGM28_06050 [Limnohabitans sp.]|nr:hypothetical protein [Limnohabitans sp.]